MPRKTPGNKWLPETLWKKFIGTMPLTCVDVIFEKADGSVLVGWRLINPYNDVWALLGGRLHYRESLPECARRIAREYGLRFKRLYLVGVFTINFSVRSDVTISLAAVDASGDATPDNYEFSSFKWVKKLPKDFGTNYRRMVNKWNQAKKSKEFLRLNRLV